MADRFTKGYNGTRHKGVRAGTIWMDSHVDGDVTLSIAFDELSDVAKIDILDDAIGLLRREQDLLLEQFPNEARKLLGWPLSDATSKGNIN